MADWLPLATPGPLVWLDFAKNVGTVNGVLSGATAASLVTCTRTTTNGTATAADAYGNYTQFGNNTLRWGLDAGASIEEARTNLLQWSADLTQATWTKVDTTITADATTAPDGTLTADLATEGSAGTASLTSNIPTVAANQTVSYSWFLKRGNNDWFEIIATDTGAASGANVWVNLGSGTLGTVANRGTATGSVASIRAVANGFFYVNITTTFTAGTTQVELLIRSATANNSTTRVNGATYYAWGGQMEIGASVSTPILTTNASGVRGADVVTVTSPPTFGSAYTLYAKGTPFTPTTYATNQNLLQVDTGSDSQRLVMRRNSATGSITISLVGGSGGPLSPSGTWAQNATGKLAGAVVAGDQGSSFNGGTNGTNTLATLPTTPTAIDIGSAAGGTQFWNGQIQQIGIWPSYRMPNAALQSLTT